MRKTLYIYILIIIASLLIMIPFNLLFSYDPYRLINWEIYMVGYILLFSQYNKYSDTLKKLLIIMAIISLLGLIGVQWDKSLGNNNSWKTNTMADLSSYLLPSLLFYASYFIPRILCLVFDMIFFFKD